MIKKIAIAIILFLLPIELSFWILKLFSVNSISKKSKFGFSIMLCNIDEINDDVKIGHFNLFLNSKLSFDIGVEIGNFNIFTGPFFLKMDKYSSINKFNKFSRSRVKGAVSGVSTLFIGEQSRITSNHFLDLTSSISFSQNSILAGIYSQLWTHGYLHKDNFRRYRVDGSIKIGSNVYIGSNVIFNPGIVVADNITIGSGAIISKSLRERGLYVSQALRFIESEINTDDLLRNELIKIEEVYEKPI